MNNIKKRTALVVDPSLRSLEGHHFGALQRLKIELTGLEFAVTSLVSAHMSADLAEESGLVRVFSRSIYGRERWNNDEFYEDAARFSDELRTAVRQRRLEPDLVIMP